MPGANALSTFQSIRLHPKEAAQTWHTDDAFYAVPRPRTKLAVSAIWALEDFTADNGATDLDPDYRSGNRTRLSAAAQVADEVLSRPVAEDGRAQVVGDLPT